VLRHSAPLHGKKILQGRRSGVFDGEFLMTWQNWAANFCYLILAGSYLVTNLLWLRVLAIVALGLEGIYFYVASTPPLWVGIAWAAIFVGINLVQLLLMTRDRLAVRMSEQERLLHRGLFAELTPVQFHSLLKIGEWREEKDEAILAAEGEPVPELLFIAHGAAKVMVGAETIAVLQAGSFVGEMSFLSGGNASASVVAMNRVLLFAVAKSALDRLLVRDRGIETVMLRVIGRDLTEKLKTQTIPG
jgi:CRP-like cAMP-binding protein